MSSAYSTYILVGEVATNSAFMEKITRYNQITGEKLISYLEVDGFLLHGEKVLLQVPNKVEEEELNVFKSCHSDGYDPFPVYGFEVDYISLDDETPYQLDLKKIEKAQAKYKLLTGRDSRVYMKINYSY